MLQLARESHRPALPWWGLLLLLTWTGVLLAAELRGQLDGQRLVTCHLRRLTGIPCPTCGGTRAAIALLEGHPLQALGHNPLVALGALAACVWLGLRMACSRRLELHMTPRGRRLLPWIVLLAIALNWAYVLAHEFAS